MNEPTHLDLFSGIGGFALAAQWAGFRTIGLCEIDKYCQKVLAKNFAASSDNKKLLQNGQGISHKSRGSEESGNFPLLSSNIFDLDGRHFAGVSLITGGFPCQPFSVAGKRRGAADDRAIWPEMFRVISEARPAWVLGENVPGIIPMELDNVLSDLEGIGYATRAFVIPACAVDARHRRDRLWVVGRRMLDSNGNEPGLEGFTETGNFGGCRPERPEQPPGFHREQGLADAEHQQLNGSGRPRRWRAESTDCCEWLPEPDVGRVAHGIPYRVDRLKGLGNAIVPQVACEILREIRKMID